MLQELSEARLRRDIGAAAIHARRLRWRRETRGPEHKVLTGRYFQKQDILFVQGRRIKCVCPDVATTAAPEAAGFVILIHRLHGVASSPLKSEIFTGRHARLPRNEAVGSRQSGV